MADTFPRQQARTRRFTLGLPRTFTVSDDGERILFLRAESGTEPTTALWSYDVGSGRELVVADPAVLGDADQAPSSEERARRERMREQADGIVAYSADSSGDTVVFACGDGLWVADVEAATTRRLEVTGPVFDPRIDPTGRSVAWCCGRDLRVVSVDGTGERVVAGEDDADVTWGQAEFVAAEEMHRNRGHWWAPDGSGLLVSRADTGPVGTWWVSDPAWPDRPPVAQRYPAAGTADAEVGLWWLGLDGTRTEIKWDRGRFPYLAEVEWHPAGPPLLVVERRNHKACDVLEADIASGMTERRAGLTDPVWVSWPPGVPTRLDDGRLVWTATRDDTVALEVDGTPVTPAGLQVRSVVSTAADIVFSASPDPTVVELWRWSGPGVERLIGGGVVRAAAAGGATVVALAGEADAGPRAVVIGRGTTGTIASRAEVPVVTPSVVRLSVGPRQLRTGVVLPARHQVGDLWPVLMMPYGGPGAQVVMSDRRFWLEAQWRADQGFAVVAADGRGTPGRGPNWEREIYGDFATLVLADQVEALHGAAAAVEGLDLERVGICGWSFGGYLSALAVLRRPDVFHAAVAGAPVTDFRLYDTYYTERYLGHPDENPAAYDRSSLLDDAPNLTRPLMLVHGLVDDNVFVAHTLRLSQKLLASGRAHTLLPLTGMTHMASGEEVAEHLVSLQMAFLSDALAQR